MKKLLFTLFFLIISATIKADGLSESIYFVTDKTSYQLNDTVFIYGMLLNPDAQQKSKLSNYCYIELINTNAKIIKRQKVSCNDGTFSCYLTLDSVPDNSSLFLRTYTRMMQNFPASSFPLRIIEVGNNRLQASFLSKEKSSFPLQLRYKNGVLVYQYNPFLNDRKKYKFTVSAGGGIMDTYPLEKDSLESIVIKKDPLYLLDCFVTNEADDIVYHKFINVESDSEKLPVHVRLSADSYKPSDSLTLILPAIKQQATLLIHLEHEQETCNNPTLQSQFLQCSVSKGESYKWLLSQKHPYTVLPEQVLSIRGQVNKRYGKLKGGSVVSFDNKRSLSYDADVQKDGSFVMGVDNYPIGTSFFLQAFNEKGKNNEYEIELVKDTLPSIQIPPLEWKKRETLALQTTQSNLDTTNIHWVPEVTIQARVVKKEPSTPHYYKTNYIEAKDIKSSSRNDLESVFRQLKGVEVAFSKNGLPYLKSMRGACTLRGDNDSNKNEEERSKFLEKSKEIDEIPIILDGTRVLDNNIFHIVDVAEIASVEYISPSRANIYGPGSIYGVVLITTKNAKTDSIPVESQGIVYYPLGLSPSISVPQLINVSANASTVCKLKLPAKTGKYKVVVEGVDDGRNIISDQRQINIVE